MKKGKLLFTIFALAMSIMAFSACDTAEGIAVELQGSVIKWELRENVTLNEIYVDSITIGLPQQNSLNVNCLAHHLEHYDSEVSISFSMTQNGKVQYHDSLFDLPSKQDSISGEYRCGGSNCCCEQMGWKAYEEVVDENGNGSTEDPSIPEQRKLVLEVDAEFLKWNAVDNVNEFKLYVYGKVGTQKETLTERFFPIDKLISGSLKIHVVAIDKNGEKIESNVQELYKLDEPQLRYEKNILSIETEDPDRYDIRFMLSVKNGNETLPFEVMDGKFDLSEIALEEGDVKVEVYARSLNGAHPSNIATLKLKKAPKTVLKVSGETLSWTQDEKYHYTLVEEYNGEKREIFVTNACYTVPETQIGNHSFYLICGAVNTVDTVSDPQMIEIIRKTIPPVTNFRLGEKGVFWDEVQDCEYLVFLNDRLISRQKQAQYIFENEEVGKYEIYIKAIQNAIESEASETLTFIKYGKGEPPLFEIDTQNKRIVVTNFNEKYDYYFVSEQGGNRSFKNDTFYYGDLQVGEIVFMIQAIPNTEYYQETYSEYQTLVHCHALQDPVIVIKDEKSVTWHADPHAVNYKVTVIDLLLNESEQFLTDKNGHTFASASKYTIRVQAVGSGYYLDSSLQTCDVSVKHFSQKFSLSLAENILSWDRTSSYISHYLVEVSGKDYSNSIKCERREFDLSTLDLSEGEYTLQVKVVYIDTEIFQSDISDIVIYRVVVKPVKPQAGSGSENEPFLIENRNELLYMATENRACYLLNNDIDLSGMEWTPFAFFGHLKGNGFSLKNMKITEDGENLGFFSQTCDATIENVNFENASITAQKATNVGLICGQVENTKTDQILFVNIFAQGTIDVKTVGAVGGFIGSYPTMDYNSFSKIITDIQIHAVEANYAGGFIGESAKVGSYLLTIVMDGSVNVQTCLQAEAVLGNASASVKSNVRIFDTFTLTINGALQDFAQASVISSQLKFEYTTYDKYKDSFDLSYLERSELPRVAKNDTVIV